MSESKNNNKDQIAPLCYMPAHYEEDEINLVDLWITLKSYKKSFFIYFMIIFILLMVTVFAQNKTKYALSSSLQIGTVQLDNTIRPIDSLEATKSKLSNVFIPMTTQQWIVENDLKSQFKTSVASDKGSDVIVLTNKVIEEDVLLFSSFQHKILSLVINDHNHKLKLTQTDMLRKLRNEELLLSQLKKPLSIEIKLKEQEIEIQNNEAKLKSLKTNYNLIKQGGHQGLLSTLTVDELSQVMTKEGHIVDQLLRVRYQKFLLSNENEQQQLINTIKQKKLLKIKITKAHNELIEMATLGVEERKLTLLNVNHSSVLSEPIVSISPTGISQKTLLALLVFVSGFLAFMGVLVTIFKDKVAQRVAEKA